MSEDTITVETYEQGTGRLLERKQIPLSEVEKAWRQLEQKAKPEIDRILTLTPDDLRNYVESTITDLGTAKEFLKTLSIIVLWLLRREIR